LKKSQTAVNPPHIDDFSCEIAHSGRLSLRENPVFLYHNAIAIGNLK
jgi:hypothetical protein